MKDFTLLRTNEKYFLFFMSLYFNDKNLKIVKE